MQYNYKTASWDFSVWIGTVLIVAGGTTFILFGDMFAKIVLTVISFVVLIPLLLLTGIPLGYTVSEQGILIRQITNILIKFRDICSVEVVDRVIPLRRLGNGGLFGYIGEFTLKDEEHIIASCTRWTEVVRIKTPSEVYIISPSDPHGFCHTVEAFVSANKSE